MKAYEIRQMSDEQLADSLRDICQQQFQLRFQATTEKLESPMEIKKLRRDIARIKTIQRERELNASSEASVEAGGEEQ
ncbi:50S ribosomal protein L29 [Planctomycetes bacterium Pan216]|uniref:Large ribosomal subunit protein uL29 n=1 Tax=Kolteria novifilia TaxID=2527975 RepID=A0A518AZJ3_9BACT|nr:50S ribosomal protein L29 [Planctomycetes bacterium Pan216]